MTDFEENFEVRKKDIVVRKVVEINIFTDFEVFFEVRH